MDTLKYQRFFDFEKENHLFFYKDDKGVYVWDIVRYYVYSKLLFTYTPVISRRNIFKIIFSRIQSIINIIITISCYLVHIGKQRDNLFYLSSRNKRDGFFFDKNADNILKITSSSENLIIESWSQSLSHKEGKYGIELGLLPFSIFNRLFCFQTYDFTPIISQIKETFPEIAIEPSELIYLYRDFYLQRVIYRFLLRKWKVKRVFMTQNGILKGLIAACKDLQIPLYELQHGNVFVGHMAYSYPYQGLKDNVYLPDKILSLSDFWFKDCILPGVKIVPTGNDTFFIQKNKRYGNGDLKVLVISANVYGQDLSSFILQYLAKYKSKEIFFYFKLHPNQYYEYDDYVKLFNNYTNILVLKGEKDVSSLLDEVDVLFTVQSTVVYEGLQKGRKICILKRGESYLLQQHIFSCPNLYLIDTIDDLKKSFEKKLLKDDNTPMFFSPFDEALFRKECLNE